MTFPTILALPLSGALSISAALVYTIILASNTSVSNTLANTKSDYIPIAYIVIASMLLYYIFLMMQSATSFHEFFKARQEYFDKKTEKSNKPDIVKIKYGSDNLNVLTVNRTVANYTEQIIPFLVSIFLCSTFVSVTRATKLGWMWIFFRSFYPLVFRKGVPTVFLSTLPAYACIWMMLGETVVTISKAE